MNKRGKERQRTGKRGRQREGRDTFRKEAERGWKK